MSKQVSDQKADLTSADAEAHLPIANEQRQHQATREINHLDISSFEANIKQGVPKEKIELNIDIEQRMRAFTTSAPSSNTQRMAEIVSGMSVKDRIKSLYEERKDSSAKKVEVPSNFMSVKDREAALRASQQQTEIRKEQVTVSSSIEDRKKALTSVSQSTNTGYKSSPVSVETSLQTRVDALQSNIKQKETEKNEAANSWLSSKERMGIWNEERFDAEGDKNRNFFNRFLKETPFEWSYESKEKSSGFSNAEIVSDMISKEILTEHDSQKLIQEPQKLSAEVISKFQKREVAPELKEYKIKVVPKCPPDYKVKVDQEPQEFSTEVISDPQIITVEVTPGPQTTLVEITTKPQKVVLELITVPLKFPTGRSPEPHKFIVEVNPEPKQFTIEAVPNTKETVNEVIFEHQKMKVKVTPEPQIFIVDVNPKPQKLVVEVFQELQDLAEAIPVSQETLPQLKLDLEI